MFQWRKIRAAAVLLAISLSAGSAPAQAQAGGVRGQVTDELGGAVIGVEVTLTDPAGVVKKALTDETGSYAFASLRPGAYVIRVRAEGFAPYEAALSVSAAAPLTHAIQLVVALKEQKEEVVDAESGVTADPDNNAGAIVLKEKDLEALPDDPDELAAALQSLAGPSAGPSGGQIYVDGFTLEGRVPPKSSIKEVRINQNPFTAEFDRLGFGRIMITTRPGTSQYHGSAMLHFNDEALNTRNPFAPTRAPFQLRYYTGDVSGPLWGNRSSFFANFQRREINDNAIINATILDPAFEIAPFSDTVLAPRREIFFSTRVDYQFNQNHSLLGQYVYTPANARNAGVGDFSLLSRALASEEHPHAVRLTFTSLLNAYTANEVRFQHSTLSRAQRGNGTDPTIRVLDAFTGGGAQFGESSFDLRAQELHNYTTWALGAHTLRVGGRWRHVTYVDMSPSNFNGTYLFTGGVAPQLGADNQMLHDVENQALMGTISSIERYRRTLLFASQGRSPAEIRAMGGGATQFSIAAGNPLIEVGQNDVGLFVQDDWRLRPNFTLSAGLRYEVQNNISSNLNFAPRLSFAWSVGGGGKQSRPTVIRGGVGIFYDRVPLTLTLASRRFDGVNQRQFIVTDPELLDLFPAVPTLDQLAAFEVPQTVRVLEPDIRAPYTTQAALSVERQLPFNTTFSATYIFARALHILRARNINAPLPGTFDPEVPEGGVRPFPDAGNIYQYETGGTFKQHQLIVNFNTRVNRRLSLFGVYALNKANSDTDGAGTFPADTFDLRSEFGRSALDIRHRVNVGGSVATFRGVELSPMVIWRSGIPFNITTGLDSNGDTLFNERPAFATDLTRPGVVVTEFGAFDPNPAPGQAIIPRNFGEGPGFFAVNLSLTKVFSLGTAPAPANGQRTGGRPAEKPYKLTFSIRAYNLFNTNNQGQPIGNLSSPLFGVANATASDGGTNNATSNRRIWLHVNFRF